MNSPDNDLISVSLDDVMTYPIYRQAVDALIAETPNPTDAKTAIASMDKHLGGDFRDGTAATKFPELVNFPGEVTIEQSLGSMQIAIPHFLVTGEINGERVLRILVRHWPEYGWDCASSTARG